MNQEVLDAPGQLAMLLPAGQVCGALIQQFMIISFGSLAASTPYLGVILLFIVLAWLRAGASLSKQFTELNIKEQKAKLMESQAAQAWPMPSSSLSARSMSR